MSIKKGYWQTRDGDVMPIKNMSDDHLHNAIAMLRRNGRTETAYPELAELVAEGQARSKDKTTMKQTTLKDTKLGDRVLVYLTNGLQFSSTKTKTAIPATVIGISSKDEADTEYYLGWTEDELHPDVREMTIVAPNKHCEWVSNRKDFAYYWHTWERDQDECEILPTVSDQPIPNAPKQKVEWVDGTYGDAKLGDKVRVYLTKDGMVAKRKTARSVEATVIARDHKEDTYSYSMALGWASWQERPVDAIENLEGNEYDEQLPNDHKDYAWCHNTVHFRYPCLIRQTTVEERLPGFPQTELPSKAVEILSLLKANEQSVAKIGATNTIYLATVLVHKPTNVLDTGTVVIYELVVDGLTGSNMHLLHSILDVIKTVEHRGDIEVHSFGMHAKEEHAFEEISDRYQTLKVKHYDPYASMITLRVSLGSGGLSIAPMPDPYMVEIDDDNYAMKRGEKIIENSLDEKKWCLPIIRSMQVPQDKGEIDIPKVKAYVDLPAKMIEEPATIKQEPVEEPKETTNLGTAAMLVGGAIGGAIMGAIGKACLNEMPSVRVLDDSAAIETITVPTEQWEMVK